MKEVYQTIFCNKKGNCVAAVMASLLNLELIEVPNFVEQEDDFLATCDFIKQHGYIYAGYIKNKKRAKDNRYDFFPDQLPMDASINGYFDATVFSPRYFDPVKYKSDPEYVPVCHAVVCDRDFNIIHDPNPKYRHIDKYPLADEIGFNGIIGVTLWNKIQGFTS